MSIRDTMREVLQAAFHATGGPVLLGWRLSQHVSTSGSSAGKVKKLIDAGADIDWKDNLLMSPLMWTICRDNTEQFRLLIDAGAEVGGVNHRGKSPVYLAVEKKQPEMLRMLLEKGAPVDTTEFQQKETALIYCARNGFSDFAAMLLDAGASPDLCDYRSKNASFYADANNDAAMLKLFDKARQKQEAEKERQRLRALDANPNFRLETEIEITPPVKPKKPQKPLDI